MKKKIFVDKHAERELREFNEEVQLEFEAYFKILELEGKLDLPHAKKVTRDLFATSRIPRPFRPRMNLERKHKKHR